MCSWRLTLRSSASAPSSFLNYVVKSPFLKSFFAPRCYLQLQLCCHRPQLLVCLATWPVQFCSAPTSRILSEPALLIFSFIFFWPKYSAVLALDHHPCFATNNKQDSTQPLHLKTREIIPFRENFNELQMFLLLQKKPRNLEAP